MKQLIIFALVCLPLLCACGGSQQKEADATYKTLTVTQSDQILKSDYTATLRGRQYVEIRPQVSGIITRICINEGDPVHKGQTLFSRACRHFSLSTRFLIKQRWKQQWLM